MSLFDTIQSGSSPAFSFINHSQYCTSQRRHTSTRWPATSLSKHKYYLCLSNTFERRPSWEDSSARRLVSETWEKWLINLGKLFGNKEMRILMLGLDAAGKTSKLTTRESSCRHDAIVNSCEADLSVQPSSTSSNSTNPSLRYLRSDSTLRRSLIKT